MPASSVDLTTSSMSSNPFSDRSAPRAPSSVTSHGTKHTRRHRSSRSHHGGVSHAPQNEFPNFAHTGDVEIVVASEGQERRYLLHRLILSQCSGFFEASTSEQWSGKDTEGADDAPTKVPNNQSLSVIRESTGSLSSEDASSMQLVTRRRPFWKYELDYGSDADDVPMLVRQKPRDGLFGGGGSSPQPRPPPARSKPPASSTGFFRSISAMQSVVNSPPLGRGGQLEHTEPPNEIIRDYDNLFRIFYNYPPNLDPISITEAYVQSKTLLTLADMYDALEVVGPRIDHHLLQFQGRLWKQIAKYPPSYLKLGYLARSKTIFSEALTHVVGQWPAGQPQLRNVPRAVLDLIEDKSDDLDELRARLEGQLFRLTIINSKGERPNPTNPHSLDWLAVSLFRNWLAENLPPPPTPIVLGFGTTANPNPTGQKSVSFHPHTTTNGRPNSSQAPMLANESMLSANGGGSGPGASSSGTVATGVGNGSGLAHGGSGGSGGSGGRGLLVPATGRAFRLMGQGGPAYLGHEELKKYLKVHLDPQLYDKTQLRRFEKRVDDLKVQAQAVVRPLTRNALQMDLGAREGGGLGYLTCAGVGDGEWPW